MTGGVRQHWDDEEQGENMLKPFLAENLPSKFTLSDGEMITDAFVIVRIVDMDPEEGFVERYEYITTKGLGFATGRGMIKCVQEQMASFYNKVINVPEDD
jgi:hypothetical protein